MQFYFMPKELQVKKVMTEFEGNFGKVNTSQQATSTCSGNTSGGKPI